MSEYTNRSIVRALGILDALSANPRGMLLTEVANAASLDRATAYRLLLSMVDGGYVHRDKQAKRYSIKVDCQLTTKNDLAASAGRIARRELRQLHEIDLSGVSVASFQGAEIRFVHEFVGRHQRDDRYAIRSKLLPSHATAAGKVMLASRPESEIRKIFEFMPLHSYTPNTISDLPNLHRRLREIREQGFAINDRELVMDEFCVSVPVPLRAALPPLALSISLSSERVDSAGIGPIVDRLKSASARVAALLQGVSPESDNLAAAT